MPSRFLSTEKRAFMALALTIQLAPFMSLPALADASIRVASEQAFVVPAAAGGMTPDQRAATMQKNIDNALVASNDHSPSAVSVSKVNGQSILTLGGFYVATVDPASAKRAGVTQEVLAQRWSDGLKRTLSNQAAVQRYVADLTGGSKGEPATVGTATTQSGSFHYYRQGRAIYIPAGMMMPVTLTTALDSENARAGDIVQASLSQPLN
ncbi:MAG TPA: hypothetical protein V6C72_03550, partial [Chroococcales cyanobacterium]